VRRFHWRVGVVATLVLGLTAPLAAVVRSVGPSGRYATIQEAIDVSVAAGGGYNDIRIERGTYRENVVVPAAYSRGILDLRGGWDSSFRNRSHDPAVTIVDGGELGRTVLLQPSGGRLEINGLTITRGLARYFGDGRPADSPSGGGVYVEPSGDARVFLVNNHIRDNEVSGAGYGAASGGGVGGYLDTAAELHLVRNRIRDNRVDSPEATAAGGGVRVIAVGTGRIVIEDNRIEENVAHVNDDQTTGAGLFLQLGGETTAAVHGNLVASNQGTRDRGDGGNVGVGGALWISRGSSGRLDARRNRWLQNSASGGAATGEQVSLLSSGTGRVFFTDSLIASSSLGGLSAIAREASELHITNITVADNDRSGVGVNSAAGATLTLFNSIVVGNNPIRNILGGPAIVGSLIGVDPRFRDATGGDYRLQSDSPAIDGGVNPLVPAERLAPVDLDGHPRVVGSAVDQGAYEHDGGAGGGGGRPCSIFSPSGPPTERLCLCFSDPGLREFRCRLWDPNFGLEARIPLPFEIGRPFAVEWVAWPQGSIEGLTLTVELPPGVKGLSGKSPWTTDLTGKPGALAADKLPIVVFEDRDAYPLKTRIEAPAAGPNEEPIDLVLEIALEAALVPNPRQE